MAFKLYELDPKPKDLTVSRSKRLMKFWRTELVFVASNWDDLQLGVKSYSILVIAGFLRKLLR